MKNVTLQIINEVGLHARPAAQFVQQAGKYQAKIMIRNMTADSKWVNAKSILSVLTLGAEKGHEVELQAEGPDEAQAIEGLADLIRSGLGESAPKQQEP
jgi:phosphotransferase system HPr (HPr) family protein